MSRPVVTMFMLQSVDGKISTGVNRDRDFETDLPLLDCGRGLFQYYEALRDTEEFFLITGKSVTKNLSNANTVTACPATCVVLDNNWLSAQAVSRLCEVFNQVIIFTQNKKNVVRDNLHWVDNQNMSLTDILHCLYTVYNCKHLSLQGGGELNAAMLKCKCVDKINTILAPVLVGGKETPSLVGGESICSLKDILTMAQLELQTFKPLQHNYVQLVYDVHYGEGGSQYKLQLDD